ncbi:metallophosphoesterase, DNA ligase-associated [Blastochloris viridis]|uniref:Metallophosphoesterase, DNA ligase-associated n=1 Tax=Blastochloris viridis TaxID=1079 RepID=A0A0S4Q6R9_BLAVI|nr:metallophosphoesterase, DNA ligase-associated [Blastochloris viridis]
MAGAELVADPLGGLWWPAERLLAVADLHFEKGSSFAARGRPLPPYDTIDTLAALARLIAHYRPAQVVALGDSFHDPYAYQRLTAQHRAAIAALQAGRRWVWIAGNHDPMPPARLGCAGIGGEVADELRLGPLSFRHQPTPGPAPGEIAGHLHPAAKLRGAGGSVRRRCFATCGARVVMPALGAYAGGLNVRDAAFAPLFPAGFAALMLGAKVYPVASDRLWPD